MVKVFKALGFLSAIACFIICMTGAQKVLAIQDNQMAQGIGIFMVGMGIFAGMAMLLLAVNIAQESKEAEATAKVEKRVKSVKAVVDEIKKEVPIRKEDDKKTASTGGPANIYISNLAETVTEADLREEFGVFGQVRSARIIADKETGAPKGYGFVEMYSKEDAKLAIEDINGQELKGQEVKVTIAKPKNRRRRPSQKRA